MNPSRTNINAEMFLDYFIGDNPKHIVSSEFVKKQDVTIESEDALFIYGVRVVWSVVIPKDTVINHSVVIKNCEFEVLKLDGVIFNEGLYIIDCIFSKGFIIEGFKGAGIYISNSNIQETFLCQNSDIEKNFWIRSGGYSATTKFHNLNCKNVFNISGGVFSTVKFDNCEINYLQLHGLTSTNCAIFGGTYKDIFFGGGSFKHLTLHAGKNYENVNFGWGEYEYVEINGSLFSNSFEINGGQFKTFYIRGGQYTNGIVARGGEFGKFLIKFSTQFLELDKLVFEERFEAENLILDGNTSVYSVPEQDTTNVPYNSSVSIMFRNIVLKKGSIYQIQDLYLTNLIFENVKVFASLYFSRIKSVPETNTSLLSFHDSDLGSTTFLDCDLSDGSLFFNSSKMTDIFVAGTLLPRDIICHNDEQERFGYSQLKKVYENRGDGITAGLYFSKEMNVYYDELSWKNHFWEKINLFMNKISSNHGQSWQRGLATVMIAGTVLYSLYIFFLCCELQAWHLVSHFFDFINPIHRYNFLVGDSEINDSALFIDSISRIFMAYFIYQFIQAFRKHGKK